jgi:hypothetical protein
MNIAGSLQSLSPRMNVIVPIWGWALLVLVAGLLFVSLISSRRKGRPRERRATILKDLHNGKLNTPAAFQARCGIANSVREDGGNLVLQYNDAKLLVVFSRLGTPRFQILRAFRDGSGQQFDIPVNVDEEFALTQLRTTNES